MEAIWKAQNVAGMCLENPQGRINTRLSFMPRPQYVQPYQFGADASKKTGLWLRGLPFLPIDPLKRFPGRWVLYKGKWVERWSNQTDSGQNREPPADDRWKIRSETYPQIAEAFAQAWG